MPSYIELDKQALFPPSSNVGKLRFVGSMVCNTYKLNGTIPPAPR